MNGAQRLDLADNPRFAVKSKEAFKFEEVKKAIEAKDKRFKVEKVVSGP